MLEHFISISRRTAAECFATRGQVGTNSLFRRFCSSIRFSFALVPGPASKLLEALLPPRFAALSRMVARRSRTLRARISLPQDAFL